VVDLARPIEWILTCPLLQLNLVLMGGSRIPEYRRIYMPLSAAVVLMFGTMTLFVSQDVSFILYGVGLCFHSVAMFFNRQQILEHSNGVEGLFSGDSEFRKATLILMMTWFPFPIWFILSPEGFGVIDNILLIQMGWAFLNIAAKFSMIFYVQRIKDNYTNRLKVKRAIKGALKTVADGNYEGQDLASLQVNGELGSCIIETMQFLGMSENIERFMKLLQEVGINTFNDMEGLTKEDCSKMQLPFDLISALQKRHKVWKLEMVDEAEQELDEAETHYKQANEKLEIEVTPANSKSTKDTDGKTKDEGSTMQAIAPGPDSVSVVLPHAFEVFSDDGSIPVLGASPLYCADLDMKLQVMQSTIMDQFKHAIEGFEQRMQVSHNNLEQGIQSSHQMLASSIGKQTQASEQRMEASIQKVAEQLEANQEMHSNRQREAVERSQATLEDKVELEFAKGPFSKMTEQIVQESKAGSFTLQMKLEMMQEAQTKQREDLEQQICSKVQELMNEGMNSVGQVVVEQTQASVRMLQETISDSKTTIGGNQSKLEQDMTQMSQDVSRECSKTIEVAMGVFGNSLRAQLDATQVAVKSQLDDLQSVTATHRMESESKVFSQIEALVTHNQQSALAETVKMNQALESSIRSSGERISAMGDAGLKDFRKYVEGATQSHQDRFRDVHSLISSVLEQACGAKTKATECSESLHVLGERLGLGGDLGVGGRLNTIESMPGVGSAGGMRRPSTDSNQSHQGQGSRTSSLGRKHQSKFHSEC